MLSDFKQWFSTLAVQLELPGELEKNILVQAPPPEMLI